MKPNPKNATIRLLILVLTVVIVSACSDDANEDAVPTTTTSEAPEPETTEPENEAEAEAAADGPVAVTVSNAFVMDDGEEIPFGEPFTVSITDDIELPEDAGNIYVFDFTETSIQMSYSSLADFDGFERVLEPGFSDIYYIEYDQPILAGLTAVPDDAQNLVPIAEILSGTMLRIELTTGMEIGDGQVLVVDLVG